MRYLIMRYLIIAIAFAVLAGCTHNSHRAAAEAAYYDSQARMSEQRQPLVEIEAVPGEPIVMAGVARFAVYAPTDDTPIQYRAEQHPGWGVARALIGGALQVYGIREIGNVIEAGFGAAGDRLHAGGNIGDTRGDTAGGNIGDTAGRDQIGGDSIDDRSVGRDRVGGDQRHGDDIRDACIGDECRSGSPGPIDESDNRQIELPPDPDPAPEPPPED